MNVELGSVSLYAFRGALPGLERLSKELRADEDSDPETTDCVFATYNILKRLVQTA